MVHEEALYMNNLINGYKVSCIMAKKRIGELLIQRRTLKSQGKNNIVKDLDLDRRIRLLYTEYNEMHEIIVHLTLLSKALHNKNIST